MATLPPSTDFTGAANQTAAQTAYANQRSFLAGLLGTTGLASDALAALGSLGGGYSGKTAAYTVTTADRGKFLNAMSGTWTLSLPAAATAGNGFSFLFRAAGSGVITIDPFGSETINGNLTETLQSKSGMLLMCNGIAWLGLEMPGPSQQGPIDGTVGAVLRIDSAGGALGLGNTGVLSVIANLDTITYPAGTYAFTATTTGTRPADIGGAVPGVIEIDVFDSGTIHQRMRRNVPLATSNGEYRRSYVSGAWGAWNVSLMRTDIIGTVAQTGGIPTGAFFERGSNANGDYIRLADGTLLCTFNLLASSAAGVTWTFPSVFAIAPVVTGLAQATVLSCICQDSAPSTTAVVLSARDKTDARRADTMQLQATGRWF